MTAQELEVMRAEFKAEAKRMVADIRRQQPSLTENEAFVVLAMSYWQGLRIMANDLADLQAKYDDLKFRMDGLEK